VVAEVSEEAEKEIIINIGQDNNKNRSVSRDSKFFLDTKMPRRRKENHEQ